MIGFDPYARGPRSTVPTRAARRVEASSDAGQAGGESRERALVPAGPRRDGARPDHRETVPGTVSRSCARAALTLQTDTPAPRRGLRADAVERDRYRRAYASAQSPAAASRPSMERVA
ncbi:MAG: hypothetical protein ABL308_07720 [Oceanicaulis sp.]